jgi:DNA-binding NarL/FixJ family response regulator
MIEADGFDAIIADLGRLDEDALAGVEAIREAIDQGAEPPWRGEEGTFLALLASNPSKDEREAFTDAGVDLIVTKGTDTTALINQISEALGLEDSEEEEEEEESDDAQARAILDVVDDQNSHHRSSPRRREH